MFQVSEATYEDLFYCYLNGITNKQTNPNPQAAFFYVDLICGLLLATQ